MTIQQALQTLDLAGSESWETIEARYVEAYNEAQIRLVNEFDEKRTEQLRSHLASLQEAFTTLQELPGTQPGTAAATAATHLTEKEAWDLLGLYEGAPKKRIRQAYLQKKEHLEGVANSGFSAEMSAVAQKELSRLEVAISLLNQSSGKITRRSSGLQAAFLVLAIGAVLALGFGAWNYFDGSQALPSNKLKVFEKEVAAAIAKANFIVAFNLLKKHGTESWMDGNLADSLRQLVLPGYFDELFRDANHAIENENFEDAKASVQKIKADAAEVKALPDYPFSLKKDSLAARLFQARMLAMNEKDHTKSAACQRIRFDLFSRQELEDKDWEITLKMDTEAGYQYFIREYPASDKINDAKKNAQNKRMHKQQVAIEANQKAIKNQELKDKQAWETALSQNDIQGFQTYLDLFPKGKYVAEAEQKIIWFETKAKELELQKGIAATKERCDNEWRSARLRNNVESYKSYLSYCPEGAYEHEAKQRIIELQCSQCRGKGWKKETANCGNCVRGKITTNNTCGECRGKRKVDETCNKCDSNGNVVCSTCNGDKKIDGSIYVLHGQSVDFNNCPYCNANGRTECNNCQGTKKYKVNCYACNGKGKITETITCNGCDGTGEISNQVRCSH